MEDDQNGRRLKWKTTEMADNRNGRRPKWKMTKMEDDQKERRPKWKTTMIETPLDDQDFRAVPHRLHGIVIFVYFVILDTRV